MENKNGDKVSPWKTPALDEKKILSVVPSPGEVKQLSDDPCLFTVPIFRVLEDFKNLIINLQPYISVFSKNTIQTCQNFYSYVYKVDKNSMICDC